MKAPWYVLLFFVLVAACGGDTDSTLDAMVTQIEDSLNELEVDTAFDGSLPVLVAHRDGSDFRRIRLTTHGELAATIETLYLDRESRPRVLRTVHRAPEPWDSSRTVFDPAGTGSQPSPGSTRGHEIVQIAQELLSSR